MVVVTVPISALALELASVLLMVVAREVVLVPPRTTLAAATGFGRTNAWVASAPPAAAAAVSRERRERRGDLSVIAGILPQRHGAPAPGPGRPGSPWPLGTLRA